MSRDSCSRALILIAVATVAAAARAQVTVVNSDVRATRGQTVSPVYEGWYQQDGTTYGVFSYFNGNTAEVVNVPIGPQNKFEPGPIDQGQPTRFVPGKQSGMFAVPLPKDPRSELTWTLTVNGQTLAIPTARDSLYAITPLKEMAGYYPGNTPPVLKLKQSGRSAQGTAGITVSRRTTVGMRLALDAWVTDDGVPPPASGESSGREGRRRSGLSVTWSVIRGADGVTIAAPAPEIIEGRASTTATFAKPGAYLLRVRASDGTQSQTMCCWTNGYVSITVER